jgi:tRNA A-37 threonylcarbamoyl transferase component Bud32
LVSLQQHLNYTTHKQQNFSSRDLMNMNLKVDSLTTTQIPLSGFRLNAARLVWVAVAVTTLIILVVGLPTYYAFFEHIFLENDQVLQQIGLPPSLRAVYYTTLDTIVIMAFCITALIIFWRRSTDGMAIFMSITLLLYSVFSYYVGAALVLVHPGWQFIPDLLVSIGTLCTFVALFVFPNGRFVPRWMRWLALGLSIWAVTWIIASRSIVDLASWEEGPRSIVYILIYGLGLAAQIYRYRTRSTPQQRQQTKWVIFGFAAALMGFIIFQVPELISSSTLQTSPPKILFHVFRNTIYRGAELFIPLTIGFSILRYRLWDIDFIVNRSLVYGTLTGMLGIIFLGVIFLLQAVFQALTGGGQSTLAAIVATLCVAAIFTPTRNRLRRFVDRRLYNIEIDYQKPKPILAENAANSKTNLGPYTGLELIGRGGMAEVFKVMHPTLNRTVAIKMLPTHFLQDAHLRKRFEREAKMLAAFKHPNIVEVFEFGESGGIPYIVMEYIQGEDLREYLNHTGTLALESAIPFLKDVASALDYAHTQQLVHRDIKPSNIMLEQHSANAQEIQRAVLMDFGIAKLLSSATQLTTGVLGTFDYMSPEQIQEAEVIDGRVDVYAFTAMIFQMLTGRLPFVNSNPGALLIAHLTQPPPDPRQFMPDLPDALTPILQRGLAKLPQDRYSTAGELVNELDRVCLAAQHEA